MLESITKDDLFCTYYAQWVRVYKEGAVRKVTLGKYHMAQAWLEKLIPDVRLRDMTRVVYQQIMSMTLRKKLRSTKEQ